MQLLVLLHFEVLHLGVLRLTSNRLDCLADQLLNSNRDVLINEMHHCLNFVELFVQLNVDLVKLTLNLHLLLLKIRLVLFCVAQFVSKDSQILDVFGVLLGSFVKHLINSFD